VNRKICEGCRRYSPKSDSTDSWWCAGQVWKEESEVIPQHSFYNKDKFRPISEKRQNPPPDCEFFLEQSMAEKEDEIHNVIKPNKLEWDGNPLADSRINFLKNCRKSPHLP